MQMITLHKGTLKSLAVWTMFLPTAVFMFTWVRPLLAVPMAAALAAACVLFTRETLRHRREDVFELSGFALAAVICCALLWTFLAGQGGYFFQNEDHYGRNAIFHDLIHYSWPVRFPDTSYALTYYVNYWMLPALVGKAVASIVGEQAAFAAANAALFMQTAFVLTLLFLMLCGYLRTRSLFPTVLALLVFVLFSGMDILGAALKNDLYNQIEWWAETFQYSSHTTCLFWVYNQSVMAWLGMMVLMQERSLRSAGLLCLLTLPYSPLPFVGMAALLMGLFIAACLDRGFVASVKEAFSLRSVLALLAVVPVFACYFGANQAVSEHPLRVDLFLNAYTPRVAFFRYVLFVLLEFGLYALILGPANRREPLFWAATATLLVAPLLRMGVNFDFAMRASIPGLFVLSVLCARFLLDAVRERRRRYAAAVLTGLLLIGAVTPMMEFERGAYRVVQAGHMGLIADPFGTVLHPDADTFNFICADTSQSAFYRYMARDYRQTEDGR